MELVTPGYRCSRFLEAEELFWESTLLSSLMNLGSKKEVGKVFPCASLNSLDGGSVRRKAATYKTTQTQNNRTQTSIPRVSFEPTIPVFERAKIVHALDRAATVIDEHIR
jgi:hypothetical protein